MIPANTSAGRWAGGLLVTLQFGLLAILAGLGGPAFLAGTAPAGAWLVLGAGAALGLWALAANRPGNFNIRPTPRAGARLVQAGPYRWIRHPMYSAVLAGAVACAWAAAPASGRLVVAGCVAALAAVLAAKALLEERWMLAAHPGYAAYRARTRRFLPWVL